MESKNCTICWKEYFKKQTTSRKVWALSKYCCKVCNSIWFTRAWYTATRGRKLTEEQKAKRPSLFQKGHTKHWAENLKKYRAEWWRSWNYWKSGYLLKTTWRKQELNKSIRWSRKYKDWRTQVFQRDDYTCQQCGIKSGCWKKVLINADHIIPFAKLVTQNNISSFEEAMDCKKLWKLGNGRTLCVDCHYTTETYGKNLRYENW